MSTESLNERELKVLEAIVMSYVETAEPVGSRTIARRFGLGVSAATIRNAMSDLEEKGYLFHPHTSAGRIPTDRAYRLYVDALMQQPSVSSAERARIREHLSMGDNSAVTAILTRAAEVLGILTQELGVAVAPSLDEVVLERLDLISVSSDRLLLVLQLKSGVLRTIFVHVPGTVHPDAVVALTVVLNDRLAGLTLREIRDSLPERLRDAASTAEQSELLDIFVATGDQLFNLPTGDEGDVVLGRPSLLADQPEFSSGEKMRELIALTEQRDVLRRVLGKRASANSLTITIGTEHEAREFADLTLVTAPYRSGPLTGVIGVLGPTRMPYEKVVALVEHTSKMVGELLK
ncbi:MAG TPA: heat-inducible transcriptional repressor HrcA [Gemmatimonadales bacterium]|nr:heat-inducible transcriptional repressor HrcA [Gemmatimonadales bacterium]